MSKLHFLVTDFYTSEVSFMCNDSMFIGAPKLLLVSQNYKEFQNMQYFSSKYFQGKFSKVNYKSQNLNFEHNIFIYKDIKIRNQFSYIYYIDMYIIQINKFKFTFETFILLIITHGISKLLFKHFRYNSLASMFR